MERSISISELSAENGVAVVNASGSIIGDNEDHVQARNQDFMWGVLTRPKWTKLLKCFFYFIFFNGD